MRQKGAAGNPFLLREKNFVQESNWYIRRYSYKRIQILYGKVSKLIKTQVKIARIPMLKHQRIVIY